MISRAIVLLAFLLPVLLLFSYPWAAKEVCTVEEHDLQLNWHVTPERIEGEKQEQLPGSDDKRRRSTTRQQASAPPPLIVQSYSIEQQKDARTEQSKPNIIAPAWLNKFICDAKLSDLLIVVFTYILAVATWLLWRTTDKLVRSAEGTARRQLRAYIKFEEYKVARFNVGQKVNMTCNIVNKGQTPAIITHMFSDTRLYDKIPDVISIGDGEQSAMIITPGSANSFTGETEWAFTEEQNAKFLSRDLVLVICTVIKYTDIFDEACETATTVFSRHGDARFGYVHDKKYNYIK